MQLQKVPPRRAELRSSSAHRQVGQAVRHDDSKLVGRTFEGGAPYLVTAERIASFCAAVGDHNPLYVDPEAAKAGVYGEIVAPPAFVASFRYADNVFDQLPRFGRGGLMSGIDFEFEAPIRAGDSIRVSSELNRFTRKPVAPAQ